MSDFIGKVVELFSTPAYIDALLHGFWLTIQISYFAILIGITLGTVIALIDVAKPSKWLVIPKFICRVYTTVIRGTPMAFQLFIMFFIIFAISRNLKNFAAFWAVFQRLRLFYKQRKRPSSEPNYYSKRSKEK